VSDIFHNLLSGQLSVDPGTGGTLTSAAFVNMPVVAAPDTMRLTLDPDGVNGAPEIVIVTAHSAAANTCTVTRGQETANGGAAAHAHPINTVWRHAPTRSAFEQLPYRLVAAKGDLIVATGDKSVTRLAAGLDGRRLIADSTQPAGMRWADNADNVIYDAKGDILIATAADAAAILPVGANNTRLVADSTQATGARWAPETEFHMIDAKGDLLVGSADNTLARFPAAASGLLMADASQAAGLKWVGGAPIAYTPTVTFPDHTVLSPAGKYVLLPGVMFVWIAFTVTAAGDFQELVVTLPSGIGGVPAAQNMTPRTIVGHFWSQEFSTEQMWSMRLEAPSTLRSESVIEGTATDYAGVFTIPLVS
jgi:hypothetical protein